MRDASSSAALRAASSAAAFSAALRAASSAAALAAASSAALRADSSSAALRDFSSSSSDEEDDDEEEDEDLDLAERCSEIASATFSTTETGDLDSLSGAFSGALSVTRSGETDASSSNSCVDGLAFDSMSSLKSS